MPAPMLLLLEKRGINSQGFFQLDPAGSADAAYLSPASIELGRNSLDTGGSLAVTPGMLSEPGLELVALLAQVVNSIHERFLSTGTLQGVGNQEFFIWSWLCAGRQGSSHCESPYRSAVFTGVCYV